MARSILITSASYSASLLVVGKSRRIMHLISSPSREWSTMLAPPAYLLDDPSICTLHWGYCPAPWHSMLVNSAMKSVTTCPLMAIRGQYYISNSLNSIAYNAIRLVASGLLIAHCKVLSVKTTTVWVWKYGLSLRAAITKVKTSFSIGGYLSSTPWNAQLM